PGAPRGREPLAGPDRQKHRDRAEPGDGGAADAQPVREGAPPDVHQAASGTNQPTLRLRSLNVAAAAPRTSSTVTAARRAYQSSSDVAAPVARRLPQRQARQVTVSVVNAVALSGWRRTRANWSSATGAPEMRARS